MEVDARAPAPVELLSMHDTAYLVMIGDRLAVAPFRAVRRASFNRYGVVSLDGAAPIDAVRQRLTLASRFPYGIPESAFRQLLASAGQTAVDNLAIAARP
jgi:hypothetical protein